MQILEIELTVAGLSKRWFKYMKQVCDNDNSKVFDMFDDELFILLIKQGKILTLI